jgi:ADP-heptose:LPS heptosyltransferase
MARTLNALTARFPAIPLVLSCAGNDRERAKLAALLARLDRQPWKVFPGTLTPLQLAAVMRRARLHIGGDSGGIHVATLTGVPIVAWYRETPPLTGWMPRGERDAVLRAPTDDSGFLRLAPEPILAAAAAIL